MKKIFVFVFIFSYFIFFPKPYADPQIITVGMEPNISMDFQDANLKDVLKMFSIQSGLNFIASEALQDRTITIYLDNVPLDKTMDNLFKANNLSYDLDKDANIFIVKDWGRPEAETVTQVFFLKHATVSSSSLKEEMSKNIKSAASCSVGATGVGATAGATGGGEGKWKSEEDVGITTAVKKLLSEHGFVIEDYRTNSLIVTDTPSRIPIIAQTIAALDIPVPQIMLEVEMLDVSKNIVDKLGFEFGESPITLTLPGGFARRGARFFLGSLADRKKDITSSNVEGKVVLGATFAQVLDFLRTHIDTKYLARPRILTLNNETAEIAITKDEIVGYNETIEVTEFGIVTTREYIRSTDLKLTAEGTGVSLRVTPQINPDTGEITLVINPKTSVTSPSELAPTQSDCEVRSTKSIIKLRDGDTVILGGLIHNDKKVTVKKLPILGDIPLVGMLFRHKDQSKDLERELLVFITPRIIKEGMELAQAKKPTIPAREQNTASGIKRELAINAGLNSFERKGH